jgi:hypothetical protein
VEQGTRNPRATYRRDWRWDRDGESPAFDIARLGKREHRAFGLRERVKSRQSEFDKRDVAVVRETIRWLCEDPDAIASKSVRNSSIGRTSRRRSQPVVYPRPVRADDTKVFDRRENHPHRSEIPHLELNGSYVSEIDAKGLIVHGDLDLANGFHASGETRIETRRIDGH